MKTTFLLFLIIKNGFSLELHFKDDSIPARVDNSTILRSCFGLKLENQWIGDDFPLCRHTSCILLENWKTKPINAFCHDYMISASIGTIAHKSICPLQGKIKKPELFVNKNYSNAIFFNKVFLFIDGCFHLHLNGVKTDFSWILSDHEIIRPAVTETMNGNESLYEKITSDEVYFDDFNQDCSKLCEQYTTESFKVEDSIPMETIPAEIDFDTLINSVVVFVIVVVFLLVLYCLNKKFM